MAAPGEWFAELGNERTCSELGTSVYLLLWLRADETHKRGPITYRYIAARSGFNERTIERWVRALRHAGWIRVDAAWNGLHVRLRSKFAPGPAQESDYEEIRSYGWQRAPKSPSAEMEEDAFAGRGRDPREPGSLHLTRARSDADPEFVVETSRGRRTEYLHDSDPPMERSNAKAGTA